MGANRLESLCDEYIQRIQQQYASLAGMSMWMLDEEEQLFGERCLNSDMSAKIIKYVDSRIAFMNPERTFAEDEYEGKKILLGKRFIFVQQSIVGLCVFVCIKEEDQDIDDCVRMADFWIELLSEYMNNQVQLKSMNKKLAELIEYEKSIEEEKQRLQKENDYDELTKVHSRTYFYKKLEEMEKQEELLPISLVVGDVNNLKFTNDMFGHRHGDILLYNIAEVLREEAEHMKEEGGTEFIVARCGGDEFNILMPNTKRGQANYYCYKVEEHLKRENNCCLIPSISLGSAKKSEMNQSLHRLLEVADAKMYAAKREFKQGQNQFEEMMEVLFSRNYLSRSGVERKMKLVREFTESLGWESERVQNCVNLMRYQDIGLTIVPERIYNKKGNYTDREWREIKKHPQLGMKLALIRPDMAPISDMMYLTHENYDGSGWPRGVNGRGIKAEVMAVRLVTDYVNKEMECTAAEAAAWIESESGRIFEPQMAENFIQFILDI